MPVMLVFMLKHLRHLATKETEVFYVKQEFCPLYPNNHLSLR